MPPLNTYIKVEAIKSLFSSKPQLAALLEKFILADAIGVEAEVRIKRFEHGNTSPYTVLGFYLSDRQLLTDAWSVLGSRGESSFAGVRVAREEMGRARAYDTGDAARPPRHDERINSEELATLMRELEIKANEALRQQLADHKMAYFEKINLCSNNFERFLMESFASSVISEEGGTKRPAHLTRKSLAKILGSTPHICKEFQDMCAQRLEDYQADLKSQYRKHIDDVELECRDWLKKIARVGPRMELLDGVENTIAKAKQYEGKIPEITQNLSHTITNEVLESEKKALERRFEEMLSIGLHEGGLAYAPPVDVQFEPPYGEAVPESRVRIDTERTSPIGSLVGVPAALLPYYNNPPSQVAAAALTLEKPNPSQSSASDLQSTLSGNDTASQIENSVLHTKSPVETSNVSRSNNVLNAPHTSSSNQSNEETAGANATFTTTNEPCPSSTPKKPREIDGATVSVEAINRPAPISTATNIITEKDKSQAWYGNMHKDRFQAIHKPLTPSIREEVPDVNDMRAAFDRASPIHNSLRERVIDISGRGATGGPDTRVSAAALINSGQTRTIKFEAQVTHVPTPKASTEDAAAAFASSNQTAHRPAIPHRPTDPNTYVDESLYDPPTPSPRPRPTVPVRQPSPPGTFVAHRRSSPYAELAAAGELLGRVSSQRKEPVPDPGAPHFRKGAEKRLSAETRSRYFNNDNDAEPGRAISLSSSSGDDDDDDDDGHVISISSSEEEDEEEGDDGEAALVAASRDFSEDLAARIRETKAEEVMSLREQEVFMNRFKGMSASEIMEILRREEIRKGKRIAHEVEEDVDVREPAQTGWVAKDVKLEVVEEHAGAVRGEFSVEEWEWR